MIGSMQLFRTRVIDLLFIILVTKVSIDHEDRDFYFKDSYKITPIFAPSASIFSLLNIVLPQI